jgi:hypothetical protein
MEAGEMRGHECIFLTSRCYMKLDADTQKFITEVE